MEKGGGSTVHELGVVVEVESGTDEYKKCQEFHPVEYPLATVGRKKNQETRNKAGDETSRTNPSVNGSSSPR